jgi:hypothetical protein
MEQKLSKGEKMLSKIFITLAFAAFCTAASAQDFYVSPTGSDKFNGLSPKANFWTNTGPFKTLARAQQAIRSLKSAGKFNQAITVHVGKGTYPISTPLEFNNLDSGLPGQEILWQGEKGVTIISGGIALKNCQAYDATNPSKILSCPLDSATVTKIKNEANNRILGNNPEIGFFVNEQWMQPARWPNFGWAHIREPLDKFTQFSVYQKMPQFTGNLSNAQAHIYANNDFFDQYVGVSNIDLTNNKITLLDKTTYPLVAARRFYLQNIEAALDAEGEWFYDKANNRILFIPPYNVIPLNIVIFGIINLIIINESSHINFSNLILRHSSGHGVKIQKADTILLDNLEINNIVGKAIHGRESTNITISNNHIHHTGQGGVLIHGGDRPTLKASGNIIDNNHIHNFDAILFNHSPAIDTSGVASTISHNLIENANGNAIDISGNDHLIEKNEITQICQQSADCGGIYSGRDWTYRGNVIRYNYLHDFYGYEMDFTFTDISKNNIVYRYKGARGIYLDDAVSGMTVFGNILVNTGTMSIQIGGGRDHRIENNVIKTTGRGIWMDQRFPGFNWDNMRNTLKTMPINSALWLAKYPELGVPMEHDTWPEGNSIQRNVIISTGYLGYSLRYVAPLKGNAIGNNLVWHASSGIRLDYTILDNGYSVGGALWNDWLNQGIEKNSLNVNPCLNISGSRISITCANSPIYSVGFQTNLPSDIGLVK